MATLTPAHSILIVEDDRAAREGLDSLLTMAGYSVMTASSGAEALARLNERRFDAMLLDIWMPQMTGLELLGRVRERPDLPKVIVMTADDTPDTLLITLRNEAHQFLRKPIDPKALLELVRRTMAAPRSQAAIVVLSARPAWVEVLVPCALEVADRLQSYISSLDVDLPADIRETMGGVFRELLLDAMQWVGPPDPNRRVRIAYLRTRRILMYRLADAGYGFRSSDVSAPAVPPYGGAAPTSGRRESDSGNAASRSASLRLQPGVVMARAQADEVLFNEAGTELVVVKYLD
jgi:CheY-like chemotaxis protein